MKDIMIMDLVVKTDDGRVKHIWPKVKHPTNGVKRKAIRVCLTFSHVHDINMMMMMMMMIMTVIITGTKSQCGRGRCGDVGTRFPSYGKQYKKSVFYTFLYNFPDTGKRFPVSGESFEFSLIFWRFWIRCPRYGETCPRSWGNVSPTLFCF